MSMNKKQIFVAARRNGKTKMILAEEFIVYIENVLGIRLRDYQKQLIRTWFYYDY